jgi:hypothetical protein
MRHVSRRLLSRLAIVGLALALGLSACVGLDTTPGAQATINIKSGTSHLSPTPTAPAYLVGAYVSDSTPTSTSGNLTIYVIFHHGQVPQAGGKVNLYFHYQNGGSVSQLNNQVGTQTTGSDGYAVFYVSFSNLPPNIPISIDVTVRFSGIPDIKEADAASFSVVSLTPSVTPSPVATGG